MGIDDILLSLVGNAAAAQMNPNTPVAPVTAQGPVEAPQRTGMFGLKGTGRDLLGLLGDAFLVQSGNKPMYRPAMEQEMLGDAYQDFTKDPMTAIAKIGRVDAPLAAKMYDSHLDSQDRNNRIAATLENQNFNNGLKLTTAAGGYLAGANANTYPAMRANLIERAKRIGQPSLFDGLPTTYDKAAIDRWSFDTMNRFQQERVLNNRDMMSYRRDNLEERRDYHDRTGDQRDQALGIQQQNADNGTTRTNKPKVVGRYVRKSDGKQIIQYDDGTEQVGSSEVRPTGRGSRRSGGSAAPAAPADQGIVVDRAGNKWKYKGSGDRKDRNNYTRVQ